jgi:hypothetical protein
LVLRHRGADIPAFLDAAAPALLVAQAIGRIGNWFNQELFGGPSTLPWALHIDLAHRPDGYERFATFHPTFLYELLWNLALAAALVVLGRTGRVRAPGLFALYVAGYSLGRIGEELLRVDPAHHLLGLRLNFFVAATVTVAGLIWFAWTQRSGRRWTARARGGGALLAAGGLLCLAGCGHGESWGLGGPPPTAGRPQVFEVPARTPAAWASSTSARPRMTCSPSSSAGRSNVGVNVLRGRAACADG